VLSGGEQRRQITQPEETVAGFEMSSWIGMFAPGGTPQSVIARLNQTIVQILRTDAVKERFATLGFPVVASTPDEHAELVRAGLAMRGELIKSANIRLD